MKDLSIIIVNTNNKPVIGVCLDSIFKHTRDLDYEVVVADNGSTDGSLEMLKSEYASRIRLVENGANLGFSKANNRGMEAAEGRAVILLNSDTELRDNAMKTLYDYLFSSGKMGACGGTLIYPGGQPQWSYGCYPSFPRMLWITLSGLLHIRAGRRERAVIPTGRESPMPVEYICGADLMMKRSVLDRVGLLDERFFVYCEETDLCRRITQAGHEIWYRPDVRIVHHIEGSFRERKKMREIIYYTSLFKYLVKHYGYYRPAKYYMMAQFKAHQLLSRPGSERHEDARFRFEAIRESTLEYPFSF
jgi:GT2 family glycosyltransferase